MLFYTDQTKQWQSVVYIRVSAKIFQIFFFAFFQKKPQKKAKKFGKKFLKNFCGHPSLHSWSTNTFCQKLFKKFALAATIWAMVLFNFWSAIRVWCTILPICTLSTSTVFTRRKMELFWSLRIFSVSRRFIWTCTKRQIIGIARKGLFLEIIVL